MAAPTTSDIHPACKASALSRLAAHTVVMPNGCHHWQQSTWGKGYGRLSIAGVSWAAHRAAWALRHGHIPWGMMVLHRCDNPPCCNPDHLFLGTGQDNMADKRRKGRGHGDLAPDIVRAILSAYPAQTKSAIARQFNAHRRTVQRILAGSGYKHVKRGATL